MGKKYDMDYEEVLKCHRYMKHVMSKGDNESDNESEDEVVEPKRKNKRVS